MVHQESPPAAQGIPGEVSSEQRQAIFREPYTPAHNRAILATSKSLLGGGLLAQRHYVLTMLTAPMPCPSCGRGISCAEAAGGLETLDISKGSNGREYRCTGCQRPLHYVLPIIGQPSWSIDHAREALEKRQGAALDAESSQAAAPPRYVRTPVPGDG